MANLPYIPAIFGQQAMMQPPSPAASMTMPQRRRPNQAWADYALGIGLGLLGGRNPQEGLATGLGLAQRMNSDRRAQERDDELFDFRRQQDERETAKEQRDLTTTQQQTAARNAAIDAMPNLSPELKAWAKAGGEIPNSVMFPQAERPDLTTFYEGDQQYQGYLGPDNKPVRVTANSPRWKNETSAGIQVDTNGDGVPDITIGGAGMKPLTGDASQQTLRATLIDQATKDIEGINFDNVSPAKTSIGSWMSENPLGEMVAGSVVLNDDEKKLIGAQGKIQEAVISAITGAAYTEEQKQNMRAAMVPLSTDSPQRKMEKLKAAAQFLKQLDKNSGYNRIVEPQGQQPAGADYKSKYGLE